jgi:hypothetical protein
MYYKSTTYGVQVYAWWSFPQFRKCCSSVLLIPVKIAFECHILITREDGRSIRKPRPIHKLFASMKRLTVIAQ